MDTDRTARQLRLIAEITSLAERIGVEVWLRGGWAVDFTLGEVTRDHRDIDWFTWAETLPTLPTLRAALDEHGYQPDPVAEESVQYDVVKDGEDLQFALLARDERGNPAVAGGPYAGEPWPTDLLDGQRGRIGRQQCPVVNPRAQIEIKQMMPVWVPGMPRRPKDAQDIRRLEARLDAG